MPSSAAIPEAEVIPAEFWIQVFHNCCQPTLQITQTSAMGLSYLG